MNEGRSSLVGLALLFLACDVNDPEPQRLDDLRIVPIGVVLSGRDTFNVDIFADTIRVRAVATTRGSVVTRHEELRYEWIVSPESVIAVRPAGEFAYLVLGSTPGIAMLRVSAYDRARGTLMKHAELPVRVDSGIESFKLLVPAGTTELAPGVTLKVSVGVAMRPSGSDPERPRLLTASPLDLVTVRWCDSLSFLLCITSATDSADGTGFVRLRDTTRRHLADSIAIRIRNECYRPRGRFQLTTYTYVDTVTEFSCRRQEVYLPYAPASQQLNFKVTLAPYFQGSIVAIAPVNTWERYVFERGDSVSLRAIVAPQAGTNCCVIGVFAEPGQHGPFKLHVDVRPEIDAECEPAYVAGGIAYSFEISSTCRGYDQESHLDGPSKLLHLSLRRGESLDADVSSQGAPVRVVLANSALRAFTAGVSMTTSADSTRWNLRYTAPDTVKVILGVSASRRARVCVRLKPSSLPACAP